MIGDDSPREEFGNIVDALLRPSAPPPSDTLRAAVLCRDTRGARTCRQGGRAGGGVRP